MSRATYGLQTGQLKDFKQKLTHVSDFARREDLDSAQKSDRQSRCSNELRKVAYNYHGVSPYQSRQEKVSKAQQASQASQSLAVKLISYRSHSTEFRNTESTMANHKWAMPDQNRDLTEL